MDTGIALIAALVAGVVVGSVVYLALRRNLPPAAAEALAAYVAAIRNAAGNVLDEATIETLAGYVWDINSGSLSDYFTREDFIAAVKRALRMEPHAAAQVAIGQMRHMARPARAHVTEL